MSASNDPKDKDFYNEFMKNQIEGSYEKGSPKVLSEVDAENREAVAKGVQLKLKDGGKLKKRVSRFWGGWW